METLKDTIKNVMRGLEAHKKASLKDDPSALLKKVLVKNELKHIRFNYFKKGVLGIEVDSSTWLYHLSLQKENLLKKLRQKSTIVIKDIRFALGRI